MGGALLLAVAVIAAVLAACAAPGAGTSNPPASVAGPTSPPATTGAAGLALTVANDPALGAYVAGANGLALYVFLNDSDGKSACTGDCAGSWPPLVVAAAADVTAGSGVTGAIGTITRDDGTTQVTLGGAPLYYFAADTAAGDTKGQGIGEVWYLASPAGTPVQQAAASPGGGGASPTPCVGRSCY
jgi:predicted lipoprotein with Yx(FWY)xxD motif